MHEKKVRSTDRWRLEQHEKDDIRAVVPTNVETLIILIIAAVLGMSQSGWKKEKYLNDGCSINVFLKSIIEQWGIEKREGKEVEEETKKWSEVREYRETLFLVVFVRQGNRRRKKYGGTFDKENCWLGHYAETKKETSLLWQWPKHWKEKAGKNKMTIRTDINEEKYKYQNVLKMLN